MDQENIQKKAEEFAALPREKRRTEWLKLPTEVRRVARRLVEARRGIRHVDGELQFTSLEGYDREIERLEKKEADWKAGLPKLRDRIVYLKKRRAKREEELNVELGESNAEGHE